MNKKLSNGVRWEVTEGGGRVDEVRVSYDEMDLSILDCMHVKENNATIMP